MSDDDLWRRPQDHDEPADQPADQGETAQPAREQPAAEVGESAVSDETQPIGGASSTPPPGPSYPSPSGPGPVPPPTNPYGQAAGQSGHPGYPGQQGQQSQPNPYGAQHQPGWNPYVDPNDPSRGYGQPTTPYPQAGGQPYGQGYTPPQNPYARPNEYGAPQSPYGSPYQPAYAGGLVQNHGSATTAMVLGIIGLASILVCGGLFLVVSPVAWILGGKAVKEIDAQPGRYAGRDRAQAGRIMGIIGTVLLVLGVLAIIGVVVLAANSDPTITTPPNNQNL